MDTAEDMPGRSVSTSNTSVADGQGEGPFTALVPPNNPQAAVPEGLSSATAALPLPAFPSLLPSASVGLPRSSAKTQRGPVPVKGSGQDRFRQLLKKNEDSCSNTVVRNSPFAVSTGTIQRPMAAQHYSPNLAAVDPPPFTVDATTSTYSDSQRMDRTVTAPPAIKVKLPPTVKKELKDSSLTQHKPVVREARGQPRRQPVNTRVGTQLPLATARLSAQCQLRHFNPQWNETSVPGGFKCSVRLINKVIQGEHIYPTAYEAKQAVAEKALVYVRRLPREDPAEKAAVKTESAEQTDRHGDRNRQGRTQVNRELTAAANHASLHGQDTYPAHAGTSTGVYTWNSYNYNEQTAFIHRVQSIFGAGGPSPAVLSDPLAAQAFLQGLALGTSARAVSSAYDPYFEPRGRPVPSISEVYRGHDNRERSPHRNLTRSYRDRSPLRRRSP
ncbi:hypothetical protein F5Y10DRAFT_264822 [Nemania abortiva]|nr:hypothetical protein F5Y10DRAFT_264822 [Nemania abortiva]